MGVDPISLAVLGTGLAAAGSIAQGRAQRRAAQANARLAEQEAERARRLAQIQAEQIREDAEKFKSEQIAAAAAQGLVSSVGSPLELIIETEAQARKAIKRALEEGDFQARQLFFEAQLLRQQGRAAQRAAFFEAGATLLGGAANIIDLFERRRTRGD